MATTVLKPLHLELKARMVEFAGFEMPVMYSDISTEHSAVRTAAGVFDLSHMGRVRFRCPKALALVQRLQTYDAENLELGRVRYAMLLTPEGTVLDDILIYREKDGFLFVINAGNREADLEVIRREAAALGAEVVDDSDRLAMVAVQGPKAAEVIKLLGLEAVLALKYYTCMDVESRYGTLTVSRTGYTGEDGFEFIVPAEHARELFVAAMEAGKEFGVRPCGLGCRDTLRLEAGMPLYGHEMDRSVNPFEAGLEYALRSKAKYIGSEAISRMAASPPARKTVALFVDGPIIPRQGSEILAGDTVVGVVCSGTRSPTLGRNIATARIDAQVLAAGTPLKVRTRRHEGAATLTQLPFYSRKRSKPVGAERTP
jgi:aminomethyltransferase